MFVMRASLCGAMADLDGDGLDDAFEAEIAASYLPFYSLDLDDGCDLRGVVYRVTPHPADSAMLHVICVSQLILDLNKAAAVTTTTIKPIMKPIAPGHRLDTLRHDEIRDRELLL